MNSGQFKQRVEVEQYDGSAWGPYFAWYCSITQQSGSGQERTFQLEGRWREEFEVLAGLDNHSEGYRIVWNRAPDVVRYLFIDDIVLPEERWRNPVVLQAHEQVE
jgi:hypothetical protein